ncbi:hypothetical protein LTR36_007436 [Oleoguttula mirabilis]|uniref:Arrestin-like N-terminal domain-containing protein n=1 Tax=Oleoguttula mirabilis TaxID=1507867 RepID=A0AAV9J9D8_9PEZI|nr:hypothetical protein LTR36_007436 [Oleoguttula mirabilis]
MSDQRPRNEVRIQFKTDSAGSGVSDCNVPCFTSDERAEGEAVSHLAGLGMKAQVKITVKGIVRTTMHPHPAGIVDDGYQISTLTVLSDVLEHKAIGQSSPSTNAPQCLKVPFSFSMIEYEMKRKSSGGSDHTDSLMKLGLPPSSDSQRSSTWRSRLFKHNADSHFHVTYTVSASIYAENRQVASAKRDFHYVPLSPPQPPVSVADFPGEYTLFATHVAPPSQPIKKNYIREIHISSDEPEPLVMRLSDGRGSTKTFLDFRLACLEQATLPQMCRVKLQLLSKTITTPCWHGKWVPTMDEVHNTDASSLKTDTSHEQTYNMAIEKWLPSYDAGVAGLNTVTATLPLRFFVTRGEMPASTFFTPLLSRRYALDVRVSFPGAARSELRLCLPLQIVYTDVVQG